MHELVKKDLDAAGSIAKIGSLRKLLSECKLLHKRVKLRKKLQEECESDVNLNDFEPVFNLSIESLQEATISTVEQCTVSMLVSMYHAPWIIPLPTLLQIHAHQASQMHHLLYRTATATRPMRSHRLIQPMRLIQCISTLVSRIEDGRSMVHCHYPPPHRARPNTHYPPHAHAHAPP
eukprot:915725_1